MNHQISSKIISYRQVSSNIISWWEYSDPKIFNTHVTPEAPRTCAAGDAPGSGRPSFEPQGLCAQAGDDGPPVCRNRPQVTPSAISCLLMSF